MKTADFLIVGGGVMGICMAREIRRRFRDSSVAVLEKERTVGSHASGRNSGVLHAGFYYSPDSLKARLTRDGNRILTEYCDDKGLRINKCGKLVVAKNEHQLRSLDELMRRGRENCVQLESISESNAREIEPRVKTHERALWSPTTSSVDPVEVIGAMRDDAINEGVEFYLGQAYRANGREYVQTDNGKFGYGYLVNAAGLYADRIARDFGFSKHYRILPFKGLYLYSDEPAGAIRTNIYPVPDLENPFLGVHYTLAVDGKIKIGPTAIPALWREQYGGTANFRLNEFTVILGRQLNLMAHANSRFLRLAREEVRKMFRGYLASQAQGLLHDVHLGNFKRWGKPGIRAQLVDLRTNELEMDFVIEGDRRSMHILNAVSPAFTCSIPMSRYVCDRIEREAR